MGDGVDTAMHIEPTPAHTHHGVLGLPPPTHAEDSQNEGEASPVFPATKYKRSQQFLFTPQAATSPQYEGSA